MFRKLGLFDDKRVTEIMLDARRPIIFGTKILEGLQKYLKVSGFW